MPTCICALGHKWICPPDDCPRCHRKFMEKVEEDVDVVQTAYDQQSTAQTV